MRLLTVAPLASGIPYEELSYFGKDEVEAGDIVEIHVKRRAIKGLVLDAQKVEDERQSIRSASFTVKKVSKVLTPSFLPPKLWKALATISSYTLVPLGVIIYDLISEKAFSSLAQLHTSENSSGFELLLLEQHYKERLTRYKTTIRESFSKKRSLVIFFPTITDLEYAAEELSRGIDDYVVSLHSSLTDKQFKGNYDTIQQEDHPLLILATPSLLPWTRADLGLVIIEREHSQYYYTHGDRGYDLRLSIEHLARGSNIPLILGSHMLSLRAHLLFTQRNANEVMPLQFRNDAPLSIIPMTSDNKSASPFFSRQTLTLLHTAKHSGKGHFFLYAHRKGMYPTTICSDCGTLFVCPTCNRPYVLHKVSGVRTYMCHGCEHIVQLDEDTTLTCRHCGGWRMTTLGIATGGAEEELNRLGIPLFVIDSERTPTRAKVKKIYKEWLDAPYGVLLGTEMAHNIVEEADAIIVLSIDSIFSLPEYRNDEKVLNLITEMAEKVVPNGEGKILLQTRLKNMPVMKQLTAPSFRDVYSTLLHEREQFLLPPYYAVIKVTFENIQENMRERLAQELAPYTVEWYEAGRGITLLFIHIEENEWANNPSTRERIKRIVYHGKPVVNPLYFFT